jgi:antagonist of KipI
VSTLLVIKPGLQTTVQDLGRWGLQSKGVGVSGPMDPFAHRVANALVNNRREAATLEITLTGPELEFDDERTVAVGGARFELTLDGQPVACETPLHVRRGSRLRFGGRLAGSRAYLAVQGGVSVTPIFGSRATHLGSRIGGLDGRALVAGDRLPLGAAHSRLKIGRDRHVVREVPAGRAGVRILPGPDGEKFQSSALDALQSAPYTIGHDSDRMGFRLEGPAIAHVHGADIISDVTPLGVLQVPASGQPVMLMADRQTTGGYARLATVIAADVGLAGQLAPGDSISFSICSRREALSALIAQERQLMALEGSGS